MGSHEFPPDTSASPDLGYTPTIFPTEGIQSYVTCPLNDGMFLPFSVSLISDDMLSVGSEEANIA